MKFRKFPAFVSALPLALPVLAVAAFNYFDPMDTAYIPALLSLNGLYAVMAAKTATLAAVYYVINAPSWSVGAA
jgi:hypothetical protein